jgi:hypothetical protein
VQIEIKDVFFGPTASDIQSNTVNFELERGTWAGRLAGDSVSTYETKARKQRQAKHRKGKERESTGAGLRDQPKQQHEQQTSKM